MDVALSTDDKGLDFGWVRTLVPLKAMGDAHLRELLQHCPEQMVFKGQSLFEAGSFDRQHIYLLHGDVEFSYPNGVAEIVKGRSSLFPLVPEQPRPCTAIALTDCSVLRINSDQLDKLLTWSQVAEYLKIDTAYQPELDEDVDWMLTILKSNLFFKVPPTNIGEIFSRLQPRVVEQGEVILRQGEVGDGCYFIKEGNAEVLRSADGVQRPQHLADIGPGRCFGEDALVNETVRNATVRMTSDGVLMVMDKQDFIRLLKEPQVNSLPLSALNTVQEQAVLIDVRTEDEYALGHLPRAVNIPVSLLRLKTRMLDISQEYVLYCDTGRRSNAATSLLQKLGYNVSYLHRGVNQDASLRQQLLVAGADYLLKGGKAERVLG
ncbi:cyclic nucleotide-binding domain-containing protein [Simiduia aestuariiviva]|uniref:CRP-like cAMP-binding protein n=1 Tax=Simiduia aestuariiviva TaxID=1510459 RepID=A0A839UL51_9GAMM|nr:cyclic nucleotide-binding domain-containing protein [Simiduia aestuariiviva]MBB3168562.1 CRP-like cAMP-binding protein [Simiduia aestuariiviva]